MDTTGNTKTKDISQYLHLYLGCAIVDSFDNNFIVCHSLDASFLDYILTSKRRKDFKPILRPLSNMTEEEQDHWFSFNPGDNVNDCILFEALRTNYLRSKFIDVDNLIESGLAIEQSSKIKEP